MTLEGIDVSQYQPNVDWIAVAHSGRSFAFARAAMGTGDTDSSFTTARVKAACSALHNRFGGYSFAYPSEDHGGPLKDAVSECDTFWRHCRSVGALQAGQLPGVLDLETNSSGMSYLTARRWIKRWYKRYKELATNAGFARGSSRRPIVYTGYWWRDFLRNPIILTRCVLWLAAYVSSPGPYKPQAFKRITFWQYSEHGRVPGINSGDVDLDRFFGELADLDALKIKEAK